MLVALSLRYDNFFAARRPSAWCIGNNVGVTASWSDIGAGTAPPTGAGVGQPVTLVEGATFCISEHNGDIVPDSTQGFYFRDTRFLSAWQLLVDGRRLDAVAASAPVPYSATFVSREHPHLGEVDSSLIVTRRRSIGHGFREDITVHNFDREPRTCRLELKADADFAGLFDVKRGQVPASRWGDFGHETHEGHLRFTYRHDGVRRGVGMRFTGDPVFEPTRAVWTIELDPHAAVELCIEVRCELNGEIIEPRHRCGEPIETSFPAQQLASWHERVSDVRSTHRPLETAVARGVNDLGALRMVDPDYPERSIVAAGAPWYMTLFGRDAIIAGWMALVVDPNLAMGVAQTLARFQGTEVDAHNEEAPGRILHEMRFSSAASHELHHGDIYYGTADATPLFVMLVGELWRWGLPQQEVLELLPAVDRALTWIERWGDADGDSFVEYELKTAHGLANQGWKDSWDAVAFADGRLAEAPIALCEVQGYVYAAYRARADIAEYVGDAGLAAELRQRAAELKRRFNEAFWLDDQKAYALALDRDKRPVDGIASNMGHCLWTGIVDDDRAAAVARWLVSDEMFSGWGVRTLAEPMGMFNPISYHNGSVWPHDNALCIAGLMRYGFVDEAHRVVLALLDLAERDAGRLPELIAGVDRRTVPEPVPYPNSCSPQAWAAAAPLMIVRHLLGIEPDAPHGRLRVSPALPPEIQGLQLSGIDVGGHQLTIAADHTGRVEVTGSSDALTVERS